MSGRVGVIRLTIANPTREGSDPFSMARPGRGLVRVTGVTKMTVMLGERVLGPDGSGLAEAGARVVLCVAGRGYWPVGAAAGDGGIYVVENPWLVALTGLAMVAWLARRVGGVLRGTTATASAVVGVGGRVRWEAWESGWCCVLEW